MECSKDPNAPHGFDRNSSHSEGRYVCECEHYEANKMTFPTELERLLKEATKAPWTARVDETVTLRDAQDNQLAIFTYLYTKTGGRRDADEVAKNARICSLLRNHADAILGLVRAAEALRDGLPEQDPYASELVAALADELAKLNGGKG